MWGRMLTGLYPRVVAGGTERRRPKLAFKSFLMPSSMPRPGSFRVGFCSPFPGSAGGSNTPYWPMATGLQYRGG